MAGTPNERGQDAADGPPQDQEPFDSASDPINRFVLVPCFAPDIAIDLPLNKVVEVGRHSHQRDLNDPHISRVQCQFVMQFDRNGIGMVHMQNQGKNASRVISGARQRQARVAKERYCRMVPGDVLELLHDHQGRYAFKLVETSPTPQPRLRDTRLVASFRMFERPRLDIDGPRALPSLEEAKARAELAATEADGRIVLGAGSESEARVRARMRAAGNDAGKNKNKNGSGMDGLGAGEAGEERAVGGTGADWSSLGKSGVTPGSQKEAQAALRGGAASRGLQALPPGVVVNIMRFLPLPERSRACRLSRRVDRMLSTGGLMDELPLGQLLGGLSNPPLELLDGLLRKSQGTARRLDFGHCRWATAGHVLAFMGLEPALAQHPLSQAQGAGPETLEDLQCDAAVATLKQMGCPGVKPGDEKKASPSSSSSSSSSSAGTAAASSKAVPRQDVATAFPRWTGAVGEGVRYVDWWHTIRCGMQVEPLQPKGEEVVRLAHDLAKEEPQDLFEMEELNAVNEPPYTPDVAANTGRAAADAPQDWLHPAFRRGYRACENPSLEVAETLLAQTQSIHAPEARHNMELFLASHLPHRAEQMGTQIMNPNLDVEACIAVSRRAAVEAYLETRRAGLCPADDDLKLAAPTNEAPNQLPVDARCHTMLPATVPPRPADPVRQAPMEGESGPAAPASGAGGGAAAAPATTGPVRPMGPQLVALRKEHEPKADGSGAGAMPGPEDEEAAHWRRREAELAWYVRHAPRGSDELASQRVVYYTCACADIFQFPYQLQRIRSAHAVTTAATAAAGSVEDLDEMVRQAAEDEARIAASKAQSQLSLNCLHPWNRRGGLVREEGFPAPSLDYCQHVLPMPASAPTQPHPAAVLSPAAAGGAKGDASSSSSPSTTTSTSGSDPAARFHQDGPFLPPASEHSAEERGLAMRARLLHGALPRPLFASGVKGINLHGCLSIRPENLLLIASYAPVLEELDLGLCQQIPNKDLCQLPRLLPNLRRIGLEYLHRTTDDFLEELGKHCPRLEQLLVPGCVDFTDDGFRALARGCKRMTHIDVRGCRKIDGSGLVAVARAGAGSLRHLSMCGLPLVTPETMTSLVRWSPALESLKAEMWSEEDGEPGPGGEVRKRRSYRVLSNVDSALRYIVATLPESNEDVQELQRSHPRFEDARRKVEERKKRAEEEGIEFEG